MNIDDKVVEEFGKEWSKFDQSCFSDSEHREMFDAYLSIFPCDKLPPDSIGFDLG